jgi:hypothetical protein
MKRFNLLFILTVLLTGILSFGNKALAEEDNFKKEITIKGINKIDITIACKMYLKQSQNESLRIKADEDIFNKLDIEQKDSTLYIESDCRTNDFDDWDVEIYVSVKELKKLDIGGAVKLKNKDVLKGEKLSITISGAADLDLNLDVNKLLADFSGAVNAELEGKANYVVMDMSGASKVDAHDLISQAFYLDFSGFGKAEIHAEKVLKVDMSGMGVIKYSGKPKKIKTQSSGLGVIKAR